MKEHERLIRISLIVIVVLVILIVLHVTRVIRPLENILVQGINTVATPVYSIKQDATTWAYDTMCRIDQNTQTLQERIDVLTKQNALLSQQLREFDQVRDITGYTSRHSQASVIANITGRVSEPGTQSLILDKGLRDGVKEGYAVIAGHGILIGKTALVTDSSSQVILLHDRRSTVAASLISNPKATGLLRGEFGLGLTMTMIPATEVIASQAVAVTSGFENNIPGGLVIGTVDRVHHDDAALFQDASIVAPLRYDQLNLVSILVP